jgi:membrane-associated HD superfamily phosphohydrolase
VKISTNNKEMLNFAMLSIITLTLLMPVMELLFVGFLISRIYGYPSPFVTRVVEESSVHYMGNIANLTLLGTPISLIAAYGIKSTIERRRKKSLNIAVIIIVIPIIVIVALIIAGIVAGIAACWYCSTQVCPGRVKSCGATWLNVYCECYSP